MEIFKLLGKIAIDGTAEANKEINGVSSTASKVGSALGKTCKAVGSAVVSMAKVGAAGIATVSTGIAALTKSAVDSYADYEQLVGGIETLFGNGGNSLEEYAKSVGKSVEEAKAEFNSLTQTQEKMVNLAINAYQTAGLSANEYMETVTSFSASLIASLGGDTAKAADVANQAIIDMSDNANKMGTSMEMIQNAYQGFAKQNYTMLDNLKLGYGGTQEEMKRLLEDATAISGIEYDISSFADITEAIHVIQTQIGITGTTAKEASSTISGSIGMMKAAWQNLLTSMTGTDEQIYENMYSFVDAVVTVANNITPKIIKIVPALVNGLSEIIKELVPYIPTMLAEIVPAIVSGATMLLSEVINELPNILETLFPGIGGEIGNTISGVISSIASLFVEFAPMIQQLVGELLPPFLDLINQMMPFFIQIAEEIMPIIIDLASQLLPPLMEIISAILPVLLTFIQSILPIVEAYLPIIQPLLDLLMAILEPLLEIINDIMPPLYEVLEAVAMMITDTLVVAIDLLKYWFEAIGEKATEVKDFFLEAWEGIYETWQGVGEFFSGIWEGIKEAFGSVTGWFEETFSKAWQSVKDVFSTGGKIFDGIKEGIADVFKTVVNGIIGGINKVISVPFNAINNVLKKIRDVSIVGVKPFDWITEFSVPEIPKLKKGAVLERGQTGYLEGDGAEAVVPLENNKKWIHALAKDMNSEFGGISNEAVLKKLDELIKAILSLRVYLNGDVLVGELAPAMDAALGDISMASTRGQ